MRKSLLILGLCLVALLTACPAAPADTGGQWNSGTWNQSTWK